MAAYEKFAGAQITGGAEATSMAYKARGGGIPIGDIPNLPRVDMSMPLAKYPGIPAIRYEEMHVGGQDWGRRAAQLQQDELPGSFSRASQRIAAATGEGQKSFAGSIGRGLGALSQGIEHFASGFAQFGERLQNETRDSANAKEDNSFDIHWSNFKAQAAKEGIPPTEWGDRFWNGPEGKAYQQEVGSLKGSGGPLGSVGLSDHLESKVAGRQAYVHANAMNTEAEQAHQSNVIAHKFRYESALAENRFDDARQAAVEAKNANVITKGEFEARMDPKHGQIKTAEDKWFADNMVEINPWDAKKEAKKIIDAPDVKKGEKGPSQLFRDMDKVQARDLLDKADKAILEKGKRNHDDVLQKAQSGNWNETQIREEAKKAHLDDAQTESIVKSVSESRPRNDSKNADLYAKVNEPDLFRNPKTAGKELRDLQQQILDTADPVTRDTLIKEVNQRWEARDKPTSVQGAEKSAVSGLIQSWFPTPEEMKKLPEAERNKLDKERMDLHLEVERFIQANPEFDAGKLREHIVDKHTPKMQEDSKKAVTPTAIDPVNMRAPYLGAIGTPQPPPKAGEGPMSLRPEDIAARQAKATEGKPAPAEPTYTTVGAGYVVQAQPGQTGESQQPPAVGTSGAPTPPTAPVPRERTEQQLPSGEWAPKFAPTQEGALTASQMPPGKLLPSKGLEQESEPGAKWATPVQGYTPSPTPATMGAATNVSAAGTPVTPQAPAVPKGEYPAQQPAQTIQPASKSEYPAERAAISQLNTHLGGSLHDKADAFVTAGEKYGVDPRLLMAIAIHETGNGTSDAVRLSNNPGGIMDPKTGWSKVQKFSTLDEGIDYMAKHLKEVYLDEGLTTIEAIAQKYAPPKGAANDPRGLNKSWPSDVSALYRQLGGGRGIAQPAPAQTAPSTGPVKIADRSRELNLPAMSRPRDTSKISKIVVHGDVLTDVDKLIDVQRNDDRGYHYYIDLDGNVTEAVDPGHIANHIKGANSDSIGIILVGADNGRMPTAAQDAAAKKLISQLAKQFHISKDDVYGHGERQPNRRDVREGGNVARDIREKGFV